MRPVKVLNEALTSLYAKSAVDWDRDTVKVTCAPYDKAGRRLQPRPAFDKQGRRIPRKR